MRCKSIRAHFSVDVRSIDKIEAVGLVLQIRENILGSATWVKFTFTRAYRALCDLIGHGGRQ